MSRARRRKRILSHLAGACVDAVQATLDEVLADIDRLEQQNGELTPDARVIYADDGE